MAGAENLTVLLERLKKNKENVPLEVLKTKYKDAYEKLLLKIKAAAIEEIIRPTAPALPGWLKGQKVRPEHTGEIAELFNRIYRDGGYAKKLGRALYKHYSADEVRQLSAEINRKYKDAIIRYFHSKTCLYTTAENWDPKNPVIPRIYNDLVDKFWNEAKGEWTTEKKPPGEALLLFISGKEPEKEEGHEQEQKRSYAGDHKGSIQGH